MDLLYNLYYSADIYNLLVTYATRYRHTILLVLLTISLLNCFFGFHLRKLWGILAGMFIGAIISATICIYIEKTGLILYIVVILGAFTLGLLALLLYRVGLFFICALLIPLILSRLFPAQKMETLFLWIVAGVIAGVLTLVREREIISTLTALGGGFGAAKCLTMLQNHHSALMIFMVGISLSLAGFLLQFQPWRSRSAWNSDKEKARDKHRHNRRMKRIRKKKKQQERMENKKKGVVLPAHRTGRKQITTEYKPYTTRPIYQNSEIRRQDPLLSSHEPTPVISTKTEVPEHQENSVNPDLSEIRQMISKEVSDIYQEQQQDLDEALDQLLEQEYQHTTRSIKKR